MTLFGADCRLSDIIFFEPSTLSLLGRFGIAPGCGNLTVAQACEQVGADTEFLLALLNTYLNEDYFPEKMLKGFPLEEVTVYLMKTVEYYTRVQLPNIERHFASLIAISPLDNNLGLLRTYFDALKAEIAANADVDARIPAEAADQWLRIEEQLGDLLNFFVSHLHGNFDANLATAVIYALFTLDKDMRLNNRIRRRILIPKLRDHGA